MSDTTLIWQLVLIILQTLNERGEPTDEKQRKVRDEINEEMKKLNE